MCHNSMSRVLAGVKTHWWPQWWRRLSREKRTTSLKGQFNIKAKCKLYQVSNGQTWGSAWIVPKKHVPRAFKVHLSKAARQIFHIGFGTEFWCLERYI